ncbi:MAG TPA: type II secretion system protein GspG [Candidatus Polarisedimenticolaceae bacterium]
MNCSSCGATLVEGAAFCTRCGGAASPVPVLPAVVKRPTGVTLLAIYDFAAAALTLAVTLAAVAFFRQGNAVGLGVIGGITGVFGVLRLAAGWGLLVGAGWARILHFVLSGFGLLNLPVGTAVGITSFIYLTRPAVTLWFAKRDPATWTPGETATWNRAAVGSMNAGVVVAIVAGVAVVGVFFVGILAAIAIPNFLNAVDRGKQKRTMADLRSIGTAIESFAVDHDAYPVLDGGFVPVGALKAQLEPTYITAIPEQDGWGHPVLVRSDGRSYVLVSAGKDGTPDVPDFAYGETDLAPTTTFLSDIVFSNGTFVRYPDGVQR